MKWISSGMPRLKNLRLRSVLFNSLPLILALVVFILVKLAVKNPGAVETLYSQRLYPHIAIPLSWFSTLFSFSLWDTFWTLVIIVIIAGLMAVIFRKLKLSIFILRIIQLVAILYSGLYILWGFNYFRPDIRVRLGWQKYKPDEIYFRQILDTITISANSDYVVLKESDYSSINESVNESYIRNSGQLKIIYNGGAGKPKKMLYSFIVAKFGLSGYFGPYFNEVNLNSRLLPMDYPFSLAHEVAHKTGITSEAEANFVAYIICSESENKQLRYSADLLLLIYFLHDARQLKDYDLLVKKVDKRVLEDLYFRRSYYYELQNKTLENVASAANDIYLKANHIKSGIKNYDQVVTLAIGWYRHTGNIANVK
jgi:hypothetical protein